MQVNRAYSMLDIKALDDDQRVITGMASTPEVDRVGDIVDPMGAKFAPEISLLWQHKHDSPVGIAEFGRPTKRGIPFKAMIAKIEEDGPLKTLVDMAWQAVKAKLVRGVSIGFRPIKYDIMSEGGLKFTETEIYELSLVTIPANASATIQTIKAMSGYRDDLGAIPLIDRVPLPAHDMKGAIQLVSARSLASVPLKARR
jgi:HK97 family phage prohead protease